MSDDLIHIQICFSENRSGPTKWIDACDSALSLKHDFNGIKVTRFMFVYNCSKCKERFNAVLDGMRQ